MKKTHQNTYGASGKTEAPRLEKLINKPAVFKAGLIILVFFALGFLIYSNTFESPFVFDDKLRIVENPAIRMDALTFQNLWKAAFGKQSARSRPIGNISFALNYYFHQYEPAGYHIVNIIIHIINAILLWLFLKKTLNLKSVRTGFVRGEWIALLAALLWLANPVQTQSVTYIVQRLNSMAAMFFLLALIFYLNGRLTMKKGRRWTWFLGAALGWLLALGCKQNTATLPFFILLYEWYFFQDLNVAWLKRNLKYVLIVSAVIIIIAFIFLGTKPLDRLASIGDYADKEFTLAERVMTQWRVVIYYLSLIFYPNPSRLNLDYDFPLSYSLLNPFTTLLSLMAIIGLIILAVFLAKKQRLISFCILWFLGNLVIESSFIPLAIIFEHRTYLPSMLMCLVPVILFYRYIKPRWLAVGAGCALILVCAYWTFERNSVWRDGLTLWADIVAKSPGKARPYANLGVAQKDQNLTDQAYQSFRKALQLNPNLDEAHFNLAIILEERAKTDEAIAHYRKAVEIKPDFVKAHNNLGAAYLRQNKLDDAGVHLRKALRLDPKFAPAHNNMGLAHVKQGKLDEAVENYLRALELNPKLAEAQFNLGHALLMQGKAEQATMRFQKALQLDPDHAEAHNNLGGQLLNQGKLDEALVHLKRAIGINPELAEAHNNVGIILIQQGDLVAAISHFQDAVRINPDFELANNNLQRALAIRDSMDTEIGKVQKELDARPADPGLHFKMGNLYLGQGQLRQAVVEFEKALALQPEFPEALNNLALAYISANQHDKALATFKKLIALQPDDASTCYNIAILYAMQNKVDEAIAWLKKAIDNGYDNWELIINDTDLENIRNSAAYKELVEGH